MPGIQPFEGETRIASEASIIDTAESVHGVVKETTRSNAALDDLNDGLDQLERQIKLYKLRSNPLVKIGQYY